MNEVNQFQKCSGGCDRLVKSNGSIAPFCCVKCREFPREGLHTSGCDQTAFERESLIIGVDPAAPGRDQTAVFIAPNSLAKENAGIEIEDEVFAAAIGITFFVKNGFVYLQGEKKYAASNVESSLWQQLRHSYGFEVDGSCNPIHGAQIERELLQESDFIAQDQLDLETLAFSVLNDKRTLSPDSRLRLIEDADLCAEGSLSREELEKMSDQELAGAYLQALRDYVNSQIG
jgi:hypothetical protein